jgi:hypothetical protein
MFFLFFSLKSSILNLFYLIFHDNWWLLSWENQIKTKEILQGPLVNNKALSRGCYTKPLPVQGTDLCIGPYYSVKAPMS